MLTGLLSVCLSSCSGRFSLDDPGASERDRFSAYFNEPGKDQATMVDRHIDGELVNLIDSARQFVYLAAYNFNRTMIIDALLRAKARGIDVRFVGDIDEFYTTGYQAMYLNHVNMTLGNSTAIQHNKFCLVDDLYLFTGTGNWSDTDLLRNNNNWYLVQNEAIVRLFKAEFMQLFNGLFGARKRQLTTTTAVMINDSPVEIYFSPYLGDTAVDRLISLVESAKASIHYMIFADTHDELAAAIVTMARQKGIPVYGIHDSNFITGVSEEAPRIYSAAFNNDGSQHTTGPFVRWDGNENTEIKNDRTHGGKLHAKTLIVDAGTASASMATGSFNWSANAVQNNDENLLIIHQPRIANAIFEQWKGAWGISNDMSLAEPSQRLRFKNRGQRASYGDIIISEIGWAGSSDGNWIDRDDDFIEIFNNSGAPIDLSHWAIQWGVNDKRNLFPIPDDSNWYYENTGSCPVAGYTLPQPNIICPGQVRIFYNKALSAFAETGADEQITYDDQGGEIRNSAGGSLSNGHFKFSGGKNFRLGNAAFKVRLYDKTMNLIDEAGDGLDVPGGMLADYDTPKTTRSLERRGYSLTSGRFTTQQPGNLPSAWFTHLGTETYSCSMRQDYSAASPPEVCLARAANTYSSAGYIYSGEANPAIKKAEAISTAAIRLTFDSNVSGAAANCTGNPTKISIALTQGNCSVPGISGISGGANSSEIVLELATGFLTSPSCRYSVIANSDCVDAANRTAMGSVLYLNGPTGATGSSYASAILNEICLIGCPAGVFAGKDWVEIKFTAGGNARGLKLYYYNESEPRLLYEFSDMYVTAGDIASVGMQQALVVQPDRTSGTLTFPLAIQLRDTQGFDATDGMFILTYCALGENDSVDARRSECSLPYKGIQDVLYYSNRDGSLTQGMVTGALTHLYENLQSFWPTSTHPVYGLTDRVTQLSGVCVAPDSSSTENLAYLCTNSLSGFGRSSLDSGKLRNAGKGAWRSFPAKSLTPNAVNTAW